MVNVIMRVRCIGDGPSLTIGKEYEVISVEKGWYRIIDDSNEDYLFPPHCFEIIE